MSQMFDALGNRNRSQQANPVQQLKENPAGFLKNMGYNIPSGVDINNPQAIINSLMQSGQIGNGRFQRAMQTINKMARR